MSLILYPFMFLAAIGFVLSVMAHLMALVGMPFPGGGLVWGLHIGIFVVWIPAVIVSKRNARFSNRKDFWKIALAGCPVWMRRTLYTVFGYAVINFIFFIITTGSTSHSKLTGEAPPSVVRGFSGHWMAFYGAAFAILYSAIHAPNLFREHKCPQGHSVAPTDRFCPKCGSPLPDEYENI